MGRRKVAKPPYRIPETAAILKNKAANGLTVISTFSGGGGSSLGLTWAGYDVRLAVDTDPEARHAYSQNFTTPIVGESVREVTGAKLLELAGLDQVDIFEGSPPCTQFSTAGRGSKGWGDVKDHAGTTQRIDDLFDEWIRVLGELQPKAFIAENVTGLIKGKSRGYFKQLLAAMRAHGYVVEARVLAAEWLGVPQKRERVIFQGVRADLGKSPVWPDPLPYQYSMADALPWIKDPTAGAKDPIKPTPEEYAALDFTERPNFPIWDRLPVGGSPRDHFFNMIKSDPDRPCPTFTAFMGASISNGQASLPYDPRAISGAEGQRLTGFPDDFYTGDTRKQIFNRVGNCVAPPVYKALGEVMAEMLNA